MNIDNIPLSTKINRFNPELRKTINSNNSFINTRLRALILISIGNFQPINRMKLREFGFSRRFVSNFITEAKKKGLLNERHFFLFLSNEGKKTQDDILRDSYISSWYTRNIEKHNNVKINIVGS